MFADLRRTKSAIRYLSFLTLKLTMYTANRHEDGFENNLHLDCVREIAAKEGLWSVPAAVEADIAELDDDERDEFMAELGLKSVG